MIIRILFVFLFLVVSKSYHVNAQVVKPKLAYLKGKLIGFGSSADLEEFSELQYLVPNSFNKLIEIARDSSFSIELEINEPTYYRLGRNKLYISPGDSLDVIIDKNNSSNSLFTGRGQEANIYLRNTPFPKGGSFIEAGRNIKDKPDETLKAILEAASLRKKELVLLKDVNKNFLLLEDVRIKSDIIRSIMSVRSYLSFRH